jgi:predicted transcriptional regulator
MTDTLTVKLDPATAARLRRVADAEGESLESLVARLLQDVSIELNEPESILTDEQLADLERRLRNPVPIASPERVAAVLSKFKTSR